MTCFTGTQFYNIFMFSSRQFMIFYAFLDCTTLLNLTMFDPSDKVFVFSMRMKKSALLLWECGVTALQASRAPEQAE